MTRFAQAALAAVALLSLSGAPAHADDVRTCLEAERGQAAIDACTRLIESGNLNADDLHEAYSKRGTAYTVAGSQYARAVQDFDQAIRLKPDDAFAYYTRGMIEGEMGNKAAQNADLAKARSIDPGVGQ
jgi:tetratricopeptide (TPR) repeat protein